jgi:hypothetical protein
MALTWKDGTHIHLHDREPQIGTAREIPDRRVCLEDVH